MPQVCEHVSEKTTLHGLGHLFLFLGGLQKDGHRYLFDKNSLSYVGSDDGHVHCEETIFVGRKAFFHGFLLSIPDKDALKNLVKHVCVSNPLMIFKGNVSGLSVNIEMFICRLWQAYLEVYRCAVSFFSQHQVSLCCVNFPHAGWHGPSSTSDSGRYV
jgi:hypothetical protein